MPNQKTVSKKPKKMKRKPGKPVSQSSSGKNATPASIPISRNELFRLHDIADSLELLRDIADEAPEMQLVQVEILIQKASRCAWNLIHEGLDDRWMENESRCGLHSEALIEAKLLLIIS